MLVRPIQGYEPGGAKLTKIPKSLRIYLPVPILWFSKTLCEFRKLLIELLAQKNAANITVCGENGTPERIRTAGLPLRRRTLYPAELRTLMEFLVPLADEVRTLRRRTLYPAELRGRIDLYDIT